MKSTKVNFDNLDLKCLTELPIVLEVLSSTGKKIGRIFDPIINDCDKTIKENLPLNWAINDNYSFNQQFFPLTSENQKKITITTLENIFKIESTFYISKKINKKETNFVYIYFGYNFSNYEDETESYYYYTLSKGNISAKYEGIINTLEYYKNILAKNKLFEIEIEHPEKGGDCESIEIKIKENDIEKIYLGYEFFKKEIIIPTLKNLK